MAAGANNGWETAARHHCVVPESLSAVAPRARPWVTFPRSDDSMTSAALHSLAGHWLWTGACGGSLTTTKGSHNQQGEKNDRPKAADSSRPCDCGHRPVG